MICICVTTKCGGGGILEEDGSINHYASTNLWFEGEEEAKIWLKEHKISKKHPTWQFEFTNE